MSTFPRLYDTNFDCTHRLRNATPTSTAAAAVETEAARASATKILTEVNAAEAAEKQQLEGGVEHQTPLHRTIQFHGAFVGKCQAVICMEGEKRIECWGV